MHGTIQRRAFLFAIGGMGTGLLWRQRRHVSARLLFGVESGPRTGATMVRRDMGAGQEAPLFSDVAQVGPEEALRFLAGKHPRYPGANLDSLMGFSSANILETCDTDVLDNVLTRRGVDAIVTVYRLIARNILEAMLDVYGGAPVVLALDAGHGGKKGVYFDPGSQGSEWEHARRVAGYVEEIPAADPRYAAIITRRIFNDDIGDDFGLPPPEDRKGAAALTIRNVRGSMLAYEAEGQRATGGSRLAGTGNGRRATGDGQPKVLGLPGRVDEAEGQRALGDWQREGEPPAPTNVQVISVHFNAGSGGTLALHQGDTAPAPFRDLSVAYARAYVDRVRPALNDSGLLPYALRLALGTGLSDDHLLYEPPFRVPSRINPYTGVDRGSFPRRYAMLQSSLLERDYADGALRFRGLLTPP